MKNLLFSTCALCALATMPLLADIAVDANVPSGNVIVDGIEGETVRLRQDMRDSKNWFYWAFRVTGAEGKTVKFVFTDPYAGGPVSCRGPVVTHDGGKTWSYPLDGKTKDNEFTYAFAADETETWFYQTFQYFPWQWEDFLKRHEADRGKCFEASVLCKSRKGRDIPKAVFGRIDGQARYRVWLSSRTHCGEAPATYVLEGWLERVFGQDALGAWLRENVEFMVVPFVDFDGVCDGDQGKGRKPHDHNRDYGEYLYPESKAIADWITERAKCRIDVSFDHHSPWVRNEYNERIYQTYHADEWNTAAKRLWGRFVMKHQDGSLNYSTADDFPWCFGWNCPNNTANPKPGAKPLVGLGGWIGENVPNLLINSTYEIPFANAKGSVVTPEKCRAFGKASAAALRDFLEAMRPMTHETVLGSASDLSGDRVRLASSPKERSWKLAFDYRFDTDEQPRAFTLKLLFGDSANPDVRTLTVAETGSFFGDARPAAPMDGQEGFLPGCQANRGAVVVQDGCAAFWTHRGGVLTKECETALPTKPLVGWDVVGCGETGAKAVFDRVSVTDGSACPHDRGSVTEWLQDPPLASADQWDVYWGKPVTAEEPMKVDFEKQKLELHFHSPFAKGAEQAASVLFNAATGTVAKIVFTPHDEEVTIARRRFEGGRFVSVTEKRVIPANRLDIGGDQAIAENAAFRVRPSVREDCPYLPREVREILVAYDRLDKIPGCAFALEAVKVGANRYRVIFAHNVLCELETPAPVVSVGFAGCDAVAHAWTPAAPSAADAAICKLPMRAGGFRLERVRTSEGADVRSGDAFDARTDACVFNVPKCAWVRAKAVCRIDPAAPRSSVPVITARLANDSANAWCEQTVDLRNADAAVVRNGDDYEITFDFDAAAVDKLVAESDGVQYLHFEFTDAARAKSGGAPSSSLIVYSGSLELRR